MTSSKICVGIRTVLFTLFLSIFAHASPLQIPGAEPSSTGRSRTSINTGWLFHLTNTSTDGVVYDIRPDNNQTSSEVLKPWILPAANPYIADASKHFSPPEEDLEPEVPFAQPDFDDSKWDDVTLPHDWAISGPFYQGEDVPVKGGMGRLPVQGIAWYRRTILHSDDEKDRTVYLDIDGAMSYAMVWVNGKLAGGWPFGYNSFRVDLTLFLKTGENHLAIRLDNPVESSRWYPGAGIYRNVWVTKVGGTHVGYHGTWVRPRDVKVDEALLELEVSIESKEGERVEVITDVHVLDSSTGKPGEKVASFPSIVVDVGAGGPTSVNSSLTISNPLLWGPPPSQKPNLYLALTSIVADNITIDTYSTQFGIRHIAWDGEKGLLVNGEHIRIQGVNQHHDLGALGAAYNHRAAQRQLEVLQEAGCNAIRMSHNPPAPELLELTDQMGFVVMDEIFDMWERQKTVNDFHLIFEDWSEADLRSFIRRDRNHPSIVAWSVGNEVGEQYTNEAGAAVGQRLVDIAHEEDATRPITASMNWAKPNMSFPTVFDILSLNYQGEGARDAPAYKHLTGITTPPQYDPFHKAFPEKAILSTETAAALSTRGTYVFPVTAENSAPVNNTSGGNSTSHYVSSYELYTADFGSSVDKVFASQDSHPFVAGEFVWSGWDYVGEPTPYYSVRSSYFGFIDLAGFKKDRFFAYQSRWRSDFKMAHILPHWTWPEREGKVTPVHVFSAADEAELWVNGESQGKKKRGVGEYRFRWDEVEYQPGEVEVKTWKGGEEWADEKVVTAGDAAALQIEADRSLIVGDGNDLSFITVKVVDVNGTVVPGASNNIAFSVSGPGEIVATDNGDPTDFTAFPSKERKTFNGLALGIVRAEAGAEGSIIVTVEAEGLESAETSVELQ